MDINATSINSDNAVSMYIQPFTDTKNKYMTMFWNPKTSATNCVDVEDRNLTMIIYNGSSIHPRLHTAQLISVDQIGDYRFEISDKNITRYDWSSRYLGHHAKAHFINNQADCLENINADTPQDSDGRVGCITDSKLESAEYYPLYHRFYPYAFDISGITIGANPDNNGDLVYYNTLDATQNYPLGFGDTEDKNVSYNIQGTFFAVDYNNNQTTNFVGNCYANPVNVVLKHRYISPIPADNATLVSYLVDYNTTDHSRIYRTDSSKSIADRKLADPIANQDVDLVVTQNSADFDKEMEGAITMDLGLNFPRAINQTMNPRLINFTDFNVTYNTQPSNLYVDMKNNHKIFNDNDNFDQDITFGYTAVATSQYMYDNIKDDSVVTPIYVYIYCDLGFTECSDRGLDLLNASTNKGNWWKDNNFGNLVNHDGNIELVEGIVYQGSGYPQLSATTIDINNNGTNDNISVSKGNGATLPLEVGIDLVANPTQPNYTDRWLIYNQYSTNQAPSPFYRVRFIGNAIWSGVGKTGNVVGTDANTQTTKRMDW
jgi:hypothetical protein